MQNRWDKQETKIKDVDINKFTSMITLKANDLNTLIKKQKGKESRKGKEGVLVVWG